MVSRHARFVVRVAYAVLRHRQDAEDAAQEMFLKLYRNRTWQGMKNERAFLARTVWRVALDHLQADRLPARTRMESLSSDEAAWEPVSMELSPEQRVADASAVAAVHRMIDALPEEFRQVLALSAVEEMNSREMAEVLEVPEGTVRTRLMRARQMLKQKMAATMGREKEGRYAR
ncbi:sigma-70 family RNA polymerase sigma factor [Silvibacterium dinghuense]|uniref:Sigma-70 family RNA polymerase sigma factor n=2 Tax=Silvibacterium dinghuense TaxID=1560006 RepID=A0A4Q1SBX8_9BACT|nr:sigma-70 family RNA polymerase sigma factor [Silvibacterium dinghuense]